MVRTSKYIVFCALLVISLAMASCYKDDIEEIDGNVNLKQQYSLPIGKKEVLFSDFINQDLTPVPDTAGIDKNFIFSYDGDFYFNPFVFNETVFLTFDFNKLTGDLESLENLMIRVNTVNEIPAKCEAQVYFSNANGTNTSIMFTDGWYTIDPAIIGNEGEIIPNEQYKKDTYFDGDRARSFIDKNTIILSVRLFVENPYEDVIHFFSDQTLQIQFAIRFGFDTNTNVK